MQKEPKQEQLVKDFFDKHAPAYRNKYGRTSAFYSYFFYERLEAATEQLDFSGKRVLDIGAGTGSLYDYLSEQAQDFDYTAVDISAGMMAESNIPKKDQLVGRCYEIDYPFAKYDLIYLLGVTTYFDELECKKVFEFVHQKLSDTGLAIITFTNRASVDVKIRNLSSYPARLLKGSEKVIAQEFKTYSYTLDEVQNMLPKQLEQRRIKYLNHTVFPFSKLLPGPSVSLAKKLSRELENGSLMSRLSSDFLIFLSKVH